MSSGALGPFRLQRELGHGGQGVVYQALDTRSGRSVALKVLGSVWCLDPGLRERFLREARAASQLDHPAFCPAYEHGEVDGQPYISMAFVPGETLAVHLERRRSGASAADTSVLNIPGVFQLVERLARALEVAHRKNVVHRDLKPGNVMITPEGEPVILDFGLAHLTEAGTRMTVTRAMLGSPAYMAPEQIEPIFGEVGPRTDVHALGVLLYECLTLRTPFEAATREGLFRAILWEEPALGGNGFSRDIRAVLERALAKEARHRYAGAAEFADDLQRLRTGQSVHAKPAGPWVKPWRWMRRNPKLVSALAGALVCLVFALGTLLRWLEVTNASLERERRTADMGSLFGLLTREDGDTWPVLPERAESMRSWLREAEGLLARAEAHRRFLEQLRGQADSIASDAGPWSFTDPERQREHDQAAALVGELADLPAHIAAVHERLEDARSLAARTLDEPRVPWGEARAAIAADPRYGALQLAPQVGLVPIGRDPASGLLEFAHPQTGTIPARDERSGAIQIDGTTGLVFVLLPGGRFRMGAVRPGADTHIGEANVDPHALADEGPVHWVELAPFFLSKYELTQGQWRRIGGVRPDPAPALDPQAFWADPSIPVSNLSWEEGTLWLSRFGLALPTEAQWEYAARGGTGTIWSCGDDPEQLGRVAHVELVPEPQSRGMSPVGLLAPNPFGLHDVHGNAREAVLDPMASYALPVRPGTGERIAPGVTLRSGRGGKWEVSGLAARSAARYPADPKSHWFGLRPARAVDP